MTENLLQSLIQYLPSPDQLNKLQEHASDYDNLAEAEQFAISLADIKRRVDFTGNTHMLISLIFRLVPRLKSLRFMLHYPELVQDCKPDIVAATAACEEVRRSKKFGKLLEIILLIGNIMNTGSRNAESVGFDISYLPKLCNTKDRDNKSTLLHFLVETVEKNHPELLNFHEELMHLEKSARVSIENVTKSLKQMDNNIKNLETDLKNARNTDPDDRSVMSKQLCQFTIISFRFEEAMGAFCSEARSQCATLMTMVYQLKKQTTLRTS